MTAPPVESITRGSSGMNENVTGEEPAAMMQFSKVIVRSPTATELALVS